AARHAWTHQNAGRASGVVLVGFSLGLMSGPPLFGGSVDLTGSYAPGFIGVIADPASATTRVLLWRRHDRRLVASRMARTSLRSHRARMTHTSTFPARSRPTGEAVYYLRWQPSLFASRL